MDSAGVWGFVAGVALVGALCSLSALGVVVLIAFRRIDSVEGANRRLEGIIQQLADKTKAAEPVRAALDDEGDFQECLLAARDLMSYVGRKSPGAQKRIFEEIAPHLINGRRVN
jgi:hypothetical protein